jgi:hypothetical protein
MTSEDSIRSFAKTLPNAQKVTDPLSLNLYSYCYNNPIRYLDPSGHSILDTLYSFGGGVIRGVGEGLSYGATEKIAESMNAESLPDGIAFQIGKIVGNLGVGIGGVLTFTGGAAGGIVTSPTGVGAVAGGAVAVAGAGAAVSGGAKAIENAVALFAALGGAGGSNGSGGADEQKKLIEELINAAKAKVSGNNTAIGRAFQKHAAREGTAFIGEITGNSARNTEQGMSYLEMILNDPDAIYTIRDTKAYGNILDVRMLDGLGARWSADGKTFIGLLERYTFR